MSRDAATKALPLTCFCLAVCLLLSENSCRTMLPLMTSILPAYSVEKREIADQCLEESNDVTCQTLLNNKILKMPSM